MKPERVSPQARAAALVPVALVALTLSLSTDDVGYTVALLGLLLVPMVLGPRFSPDLPTQRILLGIAAVLGTALGLFVAPPSDGTELRGPWCALASALALGLGLRRAFARPEWDGRVDLALGVAALLAARQGRTSPWFVAVSGAYLVAAFVQLRVEDPGRPAWWTLPDYARRRAALTAALTLLVSGALAGTVPRAAEWVQQRIFQSWLASLTESGFDTRFELGAIASLRDSEVIVLRLQGPAPAYLRGAAWNVYRRGRWYTPLASGPHIERVSYGPLAGPGVVSVSRSDRAAEVFFLPLELATLGTDGAAARTDALGIHRPIPGDPSRSYWFRTGTLSPPEPSRTSYRTVPPRLAERLVPMARAIAGDHPSADVRMARLRDHLQTRYQYARTFPRPGRRDPVMFFLEEVRAGHCEYFAGALALLGRAADVQTRVVGGYRVAERNALTGEWIVRERNAHAWVEAVGDDGRWHTYDATPSGALPFNNPHESPRIRAFFEALGVWARRGQAWLFGRSAAELLFAAAVLLLGWLGYRRLRDRQAALSDLDRTRLEAPRFLLGLDEALGRHGLARAPDETLSRWKSRLDDSPLAPEFRASLGGLLVRYSAWRYGDEGDPAPLAADFVRLTRDLRKAPVAGSTSGSPPGLPDRPAPPG